MDVFRGLFGQNGFMPHGHCYLWDPGLMRLHLVSDFLIAAAYFIIPFTLVNFVRKRRDLPLQLDVYLLWHFYYRLRHDSRDGDHHALETLLLDFRNRESNHRPLLLFQPQFFSSALSHRWSIFLGLRSCV